MCGDHPPTPSNITAGGLFCIQRDDDSTINNPDTLLCGVDAGSVYSVLAVLIMAGGWCQYWTFVRHADASAGPWYTGRVVGDSPRGAGYGVIVRRTGPGLGSGMDS
eukprot:gene3329-biopygen7430